MNLEHEISLRSQTIRRTWSTLDWTSMFSAVIYPALGVVGLIAAVAFGLALDGLTLKWWYAPLAILVTAISVVVCNQGIGPLHRVWQHRAGELKWPAQIIVGINCIIAMQGKVKDWVNYHAQHHRLSDQPGDPHNPAEGKFWAWIGWIIWRDKDDMDRPMARWIERTPVVHFFDKFHMSLSLAIHLIAPAIVYLSVWALGGSLILTFILHAAAVIGRALQFHATTLGVNVVGHLEAPRWLVWTLAVLTGGEAFHAHHHDFPKSVLHLPKRGLLNRLVDYNGTFLLILRKLRLADRLEVAPQFDEAKA